MNKTIKEKIVFPVIRGTIISVLFSLSIAFLIFTITDFREWGVGVICASVIPLVVAPSVLYRICVLSYELADAKDRIEHLAITDDLTRLFNKRHFIDLVKREFKMGERHNYSSSLAMLDIDYFKKINDRYGHLVGDAVL